MSDVKALVALLDFAEQIAVVGQAVMADGKIGLRDIIKLAQLLGPAKAAAQELKDVPAEIQTIDAAGLQEVLTKVVEVVTAIVAIASPGTVLNATETTKAA